MRGTAFRERLSAMFQDREIFVRTGGQVKFLKLSARLQRRLALALAAAFLVLFAITSVAVVRDFLGAAERATLAREQAEVDAAQAKVAKYRDNIGEVAAELDARQDYLETLTGEIRGKTIDPPKADTRADDRSVARKTGALDVKGMLKSLLALRNRQDEFAVALTATVDRRAARAEAAIRKFGIDPQRLGKTPVGLGGPFVAFRSKGRTVGELGASIATLDKALIRMERLERALVAIPSARPTNVEMVTSSYGYRRDPFTGAGAFHSGLDFRGARGTPIHAAAAGRVSFVGTKSGYGNVVEIDHGQGIVTRYAHLSRFDVKLGQRVAAGFTVARMGSTGRSTGPHLHFEVRVNGTAMDPRIFLEAKKDVLETKAVAEQRIAERAGTQNGQS